jgi:hypothetical protein
MGRGWETRFLFRESSETTGWGELFWAIDLGRERKEKDKKGGDWKNWGTWEKINGENSFSLICLI